MYLVPFYFIVLLPALANKLYTFRRISEYAEFVPSEAIKLKKKKNMKLPKKSFHKKRRKDYKSFMGKRLNEWHFAASGATWKVTNSLQIMFNWLLWFQSKESRGKNWKGRLFFLLKKFSNLSITVTTNVYCTIIENDKLTCVASCNTSPSFKQILSWLYCM